jgi:signal transduction histidine kinase
MWQSYGSVEASPHKPVSVSAIVREVIKSVSGMAAQNGLEVQANVGEDACTLMGDAVQINRAIQNVIINAVQASTDKKGSVLVDCTRKDFYVDIRVEDTGSGIEPSQMSKIFDPYFTTKQGKSGTGLGLYITKKVVEDHNGSIKVDSAPGVGTTFTIRLPLLPS